MKNQKVSEHFRNPLMSPPTARKKPQPPLRKLLSPNPRLNSAIMQEAAIINANRHLEST